MSTESKQPYCAFCGLPIPANFAFGAGGRAEAAEYCCSGCRTVAEVQQAEGEHGAASQGLLKLGLAIFFAMNVMVFAMALWSQDIYAEEAFTTPLAVSLRSVFRWAALLFSLPVLLLLGRPIAIGVWQTLHQRAITTDLLILLGIVAAYGYSVVSVLRGEGHVYFEVGAMVLVFVSIGRWLEAKGKLRAGQSLDALATLLPATVRVQAKKGVGNLLNSEFGMQNAECRRQGSEKKQFRNPQPTIHIQKGFHEIPRAEVRTEDIVRVLPGERFPVDGTIIRGQASVDQQIVTGESRPITKQVGEPVYSGTLDLDGDLLVKVVAADGNETVSRILKLVRQARTLKGRHERLADKIAVWFVPLVCLIAIVSGVRQGQLEGIDHGILTALAVVLIACPCALGLATPMAVWTALGRAARAGVLFRNGVVLEQLAKVRHACFDKTGTLTTGIPSAGDLIVADGEETEQVVQVAAALARGSTHHLSAAILRFAEVDEVGRGQKTGDRKQGTGNPSRRLVVETGSREQETRDCKTDSDPPPSSADCFPQLETPHVETLPGRGLVADLPEIGRVALGSRRLMQDTGLQDPAILRTPESNQNGSQTVFVGWRGRVRGVFQFTEQLRAEAPAALEACRELDLDLRLLTGDEQSRAVAIGEQLELATLASQLPEDKAVTLQSLSKQGGVVMIGDGLNDAPALATADVGVAMGCGADLARDAAGVCLLGDDLLCFPWAVGLARQTVRTVKQNLFWAFAYNSIGIALAATGRLNPILAALAMAASSIMVVVNSLRLGQYPEPEQSPASNMSQTEEAWEDVHTRADRLPIQKTLPVGL